MASRRRGRSRTVGRAVRGRVRNAAPLRAAAARAVDRVLSSPDAFALLIGRLEAEGWRIERLAAAVVAEVGAVDVVTSARER